MAEPVSDRGELLRVGLWLVLAGAAAGLLAFDAWLPRLAGAAGACALLILAIPWLARAYPFLKGTTTWRGRRIDLEGLGREVVPPALLVVLASALLWPLILGQMPRSQDHMVHLTRAWIFLTQLVGEGRITGWSSYWFAGYPAGQLYPPGSDLWISTFRLLGLGVPDWTTTYAHAYLAFTAAGGLAIYWLGLRATGSRLAAAVAGLLWLLDPGAYREGGWSFTVYWGVWSQVLGLVFVALALAALDRLLDRPDPRWAALVALASGFALLGHPMSVPALVVMVPCLLLAQWLCGRWPERGLAISLGTLALGGALAAWWLVPFMDRGAWTIKVPALWRTMDQAAEGVLAGSPFQHLWPVIGVLGLIGALRGARERRPLVLALSFAVAALLFGSTSTAFEGLRLEDVSASFGRIIYQRFSLPAKVGWFVLAGFGALRVVELSDRLRPPPLSSWRRIALAAVGGVLLGPFALHGLPKLGEKYLSGTGSLLLADSEADTPDYQRFLEWSRERWEERARFYRIAYQQPRNEHFMADAPVYNHTPAYKIGWTPATTFRHRPEADDPEVLRALSVRYVVSRRPLAGGHLRPERRFGRIRVYRLRGERPERYTLLGQGRAEVIQFDEERIRIRVSGAGGDTRLKVHVANYADWRASLDGEPLRITEAPIYDERYPMFMQVEVPRAGVVTFEFVRPWLRILAQLASFLALLLVAALLLAGRVERLRRLGQRLIPAARLAAGIAPVALAVTAAVLAVFVALRWAGEPRGELPPLSYAFSDHLGEVRVAVHRGGEVEACPGRGVKRVCPGPGRTWVGLKQAKVGIVERPCIWAPPPDEGELRITFPDVPLGRRLIGRHGLTDFAATQTPEGTPVELRVRVEGGPAEVFVAPNEVGWRPWVVETPDEAGDRQDVTLIVSSGSAFRRQYCFEGGVASGRR